MRAIWPLQFLSSRQCSANPSRGGKESSSHAARVPSKSSAHAHEEDAEGEQRAQRVAQVAARLQLPPLKRGSHCQKKNKSRKVSKEVKRLCRRMKSASTLIAMIAMSAMI